MKDFITKPHITIIKANTIYKQQLQNMVIGSNRIAYLVKVGPKHRN